MTNLQDPGQPRNVLALGHPTKDQKEQVADAIRTCANFATLLGRYDIMAVVGQLYAYIEKEEAPKSEVDAALRALSQPPSPQEGSSPSVG